MKRIIFLAMVASAAAMIGCTGDTELRWHNVSSNTATDIAWIADNASDTEWNETVVDTEYSSFKKVEGTSGRGSCALSDGSSGYIDVDGDSNPDSIVLNEGSSETYEIHAAAK